MKKLYIKSYVFIAGLVMLFVGLYTALTPLEYVAAMTSGNTLPSINMLSDLRGMGGMLVVLGVYVLLSAFRSAWRQPALMLAASVYATFVVFRSLGFALDGTPELAIMSAYGIELVLALAGVTLLKARETKQDMTAVSI
ncbi:protein of unknown function [Alteromonadaceae bacterium Bs31]|nr:protein of unknown function [Alteromonadaceae bacterium Bs31]